ncbi:MAG: hypothetical protein WAQ28_03465 [Bacteroidia bacterium]
MSKKGKRKSKKRAKKGGAIGFLGNATSIAKNKAVDEAGKPLLIFGGLLLSRGVNFLADKFIPVAPEDTGIKAILKKSVKPATNLLVGGTLIYIGHKKQKSVVKHLGYGFAMGGAIDTTVVIFKKNLFGMNGLGAAEEKAYKEQVEDLRKLVAENSFQPNLTGDGEKSEELLGEGDDEVNGAPFTSALQDHGNYADNPL